MSKRLSSLLAAAKLADRDIALAQARANRDSRNFSSVSQALASLVPVGLDAVDSYGKGLEEDALKQADALAAENLTTTGDAAETPEQIAQRLAGKRIAAPEKSGDVVKDFINDPLGMKKRAAEKGQLAAVQKVGAQVKGNRDAAEKKALEAAQRERENKRADETLNFQRNTDARAQTEAEAKAFDRSRATGADVIKSAVGAAIANGQSPSDVRRMIMEDPRVADMSPEDVDAAYQAAVDAKLAKDRAAKADEQQVAQGWARIKADKENRAEARAAREADKADARSYSEGQKSDVVEQKKRAAVTEVENFAANIADNIDALQRQIEDTGTFELTGTESADMERRLTAIATDMAKLADPGSVAREGEVALAKKGLFKPGTLTTRNSTAVKTLENLRGEVERRVENAYKVRGIDPAAAAQPAQPAPAPTSQVMVKLPDGRVGAIPRANLPQALALGAVVING